MAKAPSSRVPHDDLGREIDKLLKQLPMADPMLKGTPAPFLAMPLVEPPSVEDKARPATKEKVATPRPRAVVTPRMPAMPAMPAISEATGAWMRLVLAAGLGVGVAWWPYAKSCGWGLYLYLFVVASVIIAGAWASVAAWRARVAPAHVVALIVAYWGIVLAAEQILPRIEYAATSAGWSCTATR